MTLESSICELCGQPFIRAVQHRPTARCRACWDKLRFKTCVICDGDIWASLVDWSDPVQAFSVKDVSTLDTWRLLQFIPIGLQSFYTSKAVPSCV